jgi:hypothetical protein
MEQRRGIGHRPVNEPVVFACAASAGAHAALVPEHLREEPAMGIAFLVAIALLLATGVALTIRLADRRVAAAAAILFAGLIVGYVASRTSGIPLLAPDAEALDGVGIATKVVEAAGLALALWLSQPIGRRDRRPGLQEVSR